MTTTLELEFKYGIQPEIPPEIELPNNLYRIKHDIEIGDLWRKNVPEVFVMNPQGKVKLTKEWQQLLWDLFIWGAPNVGIDDYGKHKWREYLGCHRAFDNNNGFDCKKTPSHGPFADFISNQNSSSPLPAFDKPRLCGGATVRATLKDGKYWIDTLTKPIPIEQLKKEPWHYFHATTVHEDGTIGMFPQGDGNPVLVPIISAEPVHYPVELMEKVDNIVDPYQISF